MSGYTPLTVSHKSPSSQKLQHSRKQSSQHAVSSKCNIAMSSQVKVKKPMQVFIAEKDIHVFFIDPAFPSKAISWLANKISKSSDPTTDAAFRVWRP